MTGPVGGILRVLFQRWTLNDRIAHTEATGWCHGSAAHNSRRPVGGRDDAHNLPAGSPTPGREQS